MTTLTDRIEVILDAVSTGLVGGMKQGETAATSLAGKTSLTQTALDSMGISGVKAGDLVSAGLSGAAIAGGALLGKFLLDGVKQFADLTAQVSSFQRVTGASAETSSQMVGAMKLLNISAQDGDSAFGRFEQRIGSGKASLDSYGISVAMNRDGTVNMVGTLENVAQKFNEVPDATQKATMGVDLFGKGWQTLLPLLSQGKDGIKQVMDQAARSGGVFSQADLERGKQYTLAMKDLGNTLTLLKTTAGEALVPTLTATAQAITQGTEAANSALSPLGGLGGAVTDVARTLNYGVGGLKEFSAVTKLAQGDIGGFAQTAASGLPVIGQLFDSGSSGADTYKVKSDAANQATATAVQLALTGQKNTQAYKDAIKAAGSANSDLQAAQQSVSQALQTQADAASAAESAMLGLWDAELKGREAVTNVQDAMLKYNDAAYKAALAGGTDAQANVDLTRAQQQYEGSVIAAVDAAGKEAQAKDVGKDKTIQARDATAAQVAMLNQLVSATEGPVRQAIIDHINALNGIPPGKSTVITADTTQAHADLDALIAKLGSLAATTYTVAVNIGGNAAATIANIGRTG